MRKKWKEKKICRFCKIATTNLTIYCRAGIRYYFACRKCNTKRLKKYRQTKNGAIRTRLAVYKSIKKYPEKQKARRLVRYAVLIKKLVKPRLCTKCGLKKPLEAHHFDYSKPLEVIWVCRNCHLMI